MAPMLITVFFVVICRLWSWHCYRWLFVICASAATLPLLFRMESQAQGGLLKDLEENFMSAALNKESPPSFKHVGLVGAVLARPRTPPSGLIELFLIGPNLVILRSCEDFAFRSLSKGANEDRIAKAVEVLSKLQSGAPTDKMLEEKETPHQLSRVLAYLLFFDWIGIANDGSKVWILTECDGNWPGRNKAKGKR